MHTSQSFPIASFCPAGLGWSGMTHFGVQAHQEEMKHRNRVYMDHHGPSWTSWYLIDIWCHLGVIFAPINCGLSPPFSDNFGSKSNNNPHKSNEISLPWLHLGRGRGALWGIWKNDAFSPINRMHSASFSQCRLRATILWFSNCIPLYILYTTCSYMFDHVHQYCAPVSFG